MTFDPSVSPELRQSITTLENSPSFLSNSPTILGRKSTTTHRSLGSEVFCTLSTYPILGSYESISWPPVQHWLLEWETLQPGLFFVIPVLQRPEGILMLAPFFLEDSESFLPTTHPVSYSSTLIDQLCLQIFERPFDFDTRLSVGDKVPLLALYGLFGWSHLLKTLRVGSQPLFPTPVHVSQSTSRLSEGPSPASDSVPPHQRFVYPSGEDPMKENLRTLMGGPTGPTSSQSDKRYNLSRPF